MNETSQRRSYSWEWLLFGIITGVLAVLHGFNASMAATAIESHGRPEAKAVVGIPVVDRNPVVPDNYRNNATITANECK